MNPFVRNITMNKLTRVKNSSEMKKFLQEKKIQRIMGAHYIGDFFQTPNINQF